MSSEVSSWTSLALMMALVLLASAAVVIFRLCTGGFPEAPLSPSLLYTALCYAVTPLSILSILKLRGEEGPAFAIAAACYFSFLLTLLTFTPQLVKSILALQSPPPLHSIITAFCFFTTILVLPIPLFSLSLRSIAEERPELVDPPSLAYLLTLCSTSYMLSSLGLFNDLFSIPHDLQIGYWTVSCPPALLTFSLSWAGLITRARSLRKGVIWLSTAISSSLATVWLAQALPII